MKQTLTLAALLAVVTLSGVSSAHAAGPLMTKAAHVRMAVKAIHLKTAHVKALVKTAASPCCAGGNCCAQGVCCAMAGCCAASGACCDPASGACKSACGCLTMSCCAK